jgi:hypothetical protein
MTTKSAHSVTFRRETTPPGQRADVRALVGGILFSLVFTGLIAWAGAFLDRSMLLADQGASWYYWKLPEPTFWTRASAWGLYLAHQITIWYLIYRAQRDRLKYTTGLHRVNLLALGANAVFILLHFGQTHLLYDGLAQDVSIWSSQISVIILLVWVLLMENSRRGLFFGKKAPISSQISSFARKYHGYYFAWAIVYTFWYHPMESTSGHLMGFLYMFLLMLQGSLFFTRVHINRFWTALQEVMVLVHGTLVAVYQGNGLWPMFFFGFAAMFVVTQMHGLRLPAWVRWTVGAAFVAGVLLVYSQRGWANINEVVRIPVIEYLAVAVLALVFGLGIRIANWVRSRSRSEGSAA